MGVGGWLVVNPPLYMLLGSYCSLKKTLKKGSPARARARARARVGLLTTKKKELRCHAK